MKKLKIYLKDPDTLYDSINDHFEDENFGLSDPEEIELLKEKRKEKLSELCSKWFKYGEYVMLEVNIENQTIKVLEVNEYED